MTPFQKHKAQWIECRRCSLCQTRNKVVLCRGKLPAPILFIGEAPGASEDVLGKPFVGPAGKLLDHIIERGLGGQHDYCITNLIGCIPKMAPPIVVNHYNGISDIRIDRTGEWGNPFILGKHGNREQVIAKYRKWILTQDKLLAKLPTLTGKRLGCHCKPRACHGDVLVELFKQRVPLDKLTDPPGFAISACLPRVHEMYKLCRPQVIVRVGKCATNTILSNACNANVIDIIHPAAILRIDVSQQGLAIQRSIVALEDAVEGL